MEGISSQVATVDYLQLLTIQLQNQDPIDPVDQEGLINDLTQFSMLEGVEDLNTSFGDLLKLQQVSHGVGLVGKEINYQDPASGELRSGVVSEMLNIDDTLSLIVGDDTVSLDSVIGTKQAA